MPRAAFHITNHVVLLLMALLVTLTGALSGCTKEYHKAVSLSTDLRFCSLWQHSLVKAE
jgi:hypothetical protein